jgi:hypothetical protein
VSKCCGSLLIKESGRLFYTGTRIRRQDDVYDFVKVYLSAKTAKTQPQLVRKASYFYWSLKATLYKNAMVSTKQVGNIVFYCLFVRFAPITFPKSSLYKISPQAHTDRKLFFLVFWFKKCSSWWVKKVGVHPDRFWQIYMASTLYHCNLTRKIWQGLQEYGGGGPGFAKKRVGKIGELWNTVKGIQLKKTTQRHMRKRCALKNVYVDLYNFDEFALLKGFIWNLNVKLFLTINLSTIHEAEELGVLLRLIVNTIFQPSVLKDKTILKRYQ